MFSQVTYYELIADEHWARIEEFIRCSDECVKNILLYLRSRGATSVIIEHEYIDRDFTSEFAAFYALVFRRHKKVCRRLHFFSKKLKSDPNLFCLLQGLEKSSKEGYYLGYIVLRPLESAPIGRTVLAIPQPPASEATTVLVRAKHDIHVLGVELTVEGTPFMQQDARIGACAHASIWMAARHLHVKHREGWFSTVDIAERASNPTDVILASSLPSGSGGLGLNNMLRAIRAMGREPVIYLAEMIETAEGTQLKWPNTLRSEDIINRYIDSGIPVILIIKPWQAQQREGHAITCFGHVQGKLSEIPSLTNRPTRALFCNSFLVNDDQRGCYLEMPIHSRNAQGDTPYCVSTHVYGIIIPLPNKVYIKAEIAEEIAWYRIDTFCNIWSTLSRKCRCNVSHVEEFLNIVKQNKLVARTYLTHGWKYKKRIYNNIINQEAKALILRQDLPRFVWVTEFGDFDRLNYTDSTNARILSHVVVDATTGQYWDSGSLICHVPGFVFLWSHNSENESGPYEQQIYALIEDSPYYPRIRGQSGKILTTQVI